MKKGIILLFGILVPSALIYMVWLGYGVLFEPNVNKDVAPYTLYVKPALDVNDVYAQLLNDEVLNNPEGFLLIADRKGLKHPKSGHYIITEDMSSNSVVNMFMAGLQTPVKVTFTGASSLAEVAGKLAPQLLQDSSSILQALEVPRKGWEGDMSLGAYLPDTYEFFWNATPETIAKKIYQNTIEFWTPSRILLANELGLTASELSTLASIVMKESQKSEDRPLVARLYLNRLDKGMKLQADPTVIYALKRKSPGLQVRRVLRKDLKIEDPFNTYFIKGLPPGPICVPEKDALLAVLNAPFHEYLYMCADPDKIGYHAFARSYKEHLRNQKKWTRYLNRQNIYR